MKRTYLDILSRYFDFVEFRVVEIGQQTFPNVQSFLAWPIIQTLFVSIVQTLHPSDVFTESYLMSQKVLVHDLLQLEIY